MIGSKIEFAGSARGLICMISADVLAAEKRELSKLDELESEIAKELGATKQKD